MLTLLWLLIIFAVLIGLGSLMGLAAMRLFDYDAEKPETPKHRQRRSLLVALRLDHPKPATNRFLQALSVQPPKPGRHP